MPIANRTQSLALPATIDETAARTALEVARHGFYRESMHGISIEVELFFLPNAETVRASTTWEGVTPERPDQVDPDKLVLTRQLPGTDVNELRATLEVSIATDFDIATFRTDEPGTTRGDWTFDRIEFGEIVMKGKGLDDDTLIVGIDADGRRLTLDQSPRYDEYGRSRFGDGPSDEYHFEFDGEVAEIRLYTATARVTVDNALSLHPDRGSQGARFRTLGPTNLVELTEDEVRSAITTEAARDQYVDSNCPCKLRVQLPKVDNSTYATVDADLELFDGDAAIGGFEIETRPDRNDRTVSHHFASEQSLGTPTRIAGTIKVRYPRRVDVVRIARGDTDPEGRIEVEFDGPEGLDGPTTLVRYDPDRVEGLHVERSAFDPEEIEPVVGLHESGLPLKDHLLQPKHRVDGDRHELRYQFQGRVDAVLVKIPSEFCEIEIPVDEAVSLRSEPGLEVVGEVIGDVVGGVRNLRQLTKLATITFWIGVLCAVLKLISVPPLATWSWWLVLSPILASFACAILNFAMIARTMLKVRDTLSGVGEVSAG